MVLIVLCWSQINFHHKKRPPKKEIKKFIQILIRHLRKKFNKINHFNFFDIKQKTKPNRSCVWFLKTFSKNISFLWHENLMIMSTYFDTLKFRPRPGTNDYFFYQVHLWVVEWGCKYGQCELCKNSWSHNRCLNDNITHNYYEWQRWRHKIFQGKGEISRGFPIFFKWDFYLWHDKTQSNNSKKHL